MKGPVLVAAVLTLTATTASAGGFVGLGIGTSPAHGVDSFAEDGRSGRLELGYSFGRISVEGMGTRFDMARDDGATYSATSLGIAGLYTLPLSDGFDVFGRLGLQHTTLSPNNQSPAHTGGGILFGGGAQFRLPTAAVKLAIFVDYTIARSSVAPETHPDYEYSLTTRIWTLGAKLGF